MDGIPIRNLWLLMLYASDLFRMRGTDSFDVEQMPDVLPDIVAELLVHAVEERLRRNLHRTYETEHAVLDRIRGAIDVLATESGQLLHRGKIACRYQEHTTDTLRNRYVRSALDSIARLTSTDLARRCRRLANDLRNMGVTGSKPPNSQISTDRFGRHDADDRLMVATARLAFDLSLPTETTGSELLARTDHNPHWLRKLYERAVFGFYKVVLSSDEWLVLPGRVLHWPLTARTPNLDVILPRMETDIELLHRQSRRKIVIDTKFTTLLKPAQFGGRTIHSAYLYQIYAYLRSQVDIDASPAEGVLLHPATDGLIDEAARIQGHLIRFTTVDLCGSPETLRSDLLRIVRDPPPHLIYDVDSR